MRIGKRGLQFAILIVFAVCSSGSPVLTPEAYAQTGGGSGTSPAPLPTPSPSPTPPPFQSPFPNPKPGPGEEAAFNNLITLHDKWQSAVDALAAAQKCGSKSDIATANAALDAAKKAYFDALNEYIQNYSNQPYPPGPPFDPGTKNRKTMEQRFNIDIYKVSTAVDKASKYKHVPVGDCPTVPVSSPSPTPKPTPKRGLLDNILGHVTIGVGGGHDHGDRRDSGHPDKPPPATPTAPSPQD